MASSAWRRPFRSERPPGAERSERNGRGGKLRKVRLPGVLADEVVLHHGVPCGQAPPFGAVHEKTALFQAVRWHAPAGWVRARPWPQLAARCDQLRTADCRSARGGGQLEAFRARRSMARRLPRCRPGCLPAPQRGTEGKRGCGGILWTTIPSRVRMSVENRISDGVSPSWGAPQGSTRDERLGSGGHPWGVPVTCCSSWGGLQ